MHQAIRDSKARIIIVFEANVNITVPEPPDLRQRTFMGFKFEDEIFNGSTTARLSVFIHHEIEYEREHYLKNDINCIVILKVKRKKRK